MTRLPLAIGAIHFVGIGGIGMSGIAEVMHNLGYQVQGSDLSVSTNVLRLRALGIEVVAGHDAENIGDAKVLVVSSAVKPDNPEVVAARAKVAASTVSRVLNDGYASPAVKARVLKVIEDLEYVPSTTARGLKTGRKACIGVVVESSQGSWFTQLLGGVEEALADQDWERVWLDQFQPMRFGERLWVCPARQLPPVDGETVIVDLDPGLELEGDLLLVQRAVDYSIKLIARKIVLKVHQTDLVTVYTYLIPLSRWERSGEGEI